LCSKASAKVSSFFHFSKFFAAFLLLSSFLCLFVWVLIVVAVVCVQRMVYMPFCNMLISNELQKAVFCVIKDGLLACGLRPFATRKAVNCVMPVCGRLGGKTQLAVAMLCNDEQNE